MDRLEIKRKFDGIRLFQIGGLRALHKPLVLLYALARCSRHEERLFCFGDVEEDLKQLLRDYFPSRNPRPQFPFWRLQNDGLWEFSETGGHPLNLDPPVGFLRDPGTKAGFPPEIYVRLREDISLLQELAAGLLSDYFPNSLHEDLLDAVGMVFTPIGRPRRDPKFREEVLRAYRYACGVCGYD